METALYRLLAKFIYSHEIFPSAASELFSSCSQNLQGSREGSAVGHHDAGIRHAHGQVSLQVQVCKPFYSGHKISPFSGPFTALAEQERPYKTLGARGEEKGPSPALGFPEVSPNLA